MNYSFGYTINGSNPFINISRDGFVETDTSHLVEKKVVFFGEISMLNPGELTDFFFFGWSGISWFFSAP